MKNTADLLIQYDRLMAHACDAFPLVSDSESMLAMINEAGKAGANLLWLKATWASKMFFSDWKGTDEELAAHHKRIPWATPKHGDWRSLYKSGRDYNFYTDEWEMPE